MKARLLVLATIALVMACSDARTNSGPTAPDASSKLISDGAHGGNPDFFFLPPMVANPSNDPNYEPGTFNATLAPALAVEICLLQGSPVNALGQPVITDCVAGPPMKKFPAGTVQLQNPPDGFYQVVWNAGASNLDVTRFYRIKVLVDGSSTPFGVADIDPVANAKELRNARTGEIIPLNENSSLPIKFRIEHAGGTTLCGTATVCVSRTISNNSPTGSQTLTVDNGAGAIAGADFPNGWLPAGGPQSVVVTIAQFDVGSTNPVTGTESKPCHLDLALQQFPGCFTFTTTPKLAPINGESGPQFAKRVRAAVCFTLYGGNDPREQFAEMYASGPNEPAHALEDASDVGLIAPDRRNCSSGGEVIGALPTNPLTRYATVGWRKMRSGFGQIFGVKTAYAVDAGLGGWLDAFSNVGPAISATIQPVGATHFDLTSGGTLHPDVRLVGSNHHDGQHQNSVGLGGLPVTWTVSGTATALVPFGTEGGGVATLVDQTNTLPIDGGATSGGGYSTVNWIVPSTPGDYTVTAAGAALSGPVTFTVTVTAPVLTGLVLFDAPDIGANDRQVADPYTDAATGVVFTAGPSGIVGISRNLASGTSVCVAPLLPSGGFGTGDGNQKLGTAPVGSTSIGLSGFPIKATFPTVMPAGTLVSVDVQTAFDVGANLLRLRFLDASGAEVSSITQTVQDVDVVDSRCDGAPGTNKRGTVRLITTATQAFKAIVVEGPAGFVFVIDQFQFATSGTFD